MIGGASVIWLEGYAVANENWIGGCIREHGLEMSCVEFGASQREDG